MEGYVEQDGFGDLPRLDKEKRQRASTEKNAKLRSPLFFINPRRLSIRNLSKSVDEVGLKALIVKGIENGLKNKLISEEDVTNELKAKGAPLRECIGDNAKIPDFNSKVRLACFSAPSHMRCRQA